MPDSGAARAARRGVGIALCLIVAMELIISSGCATFGRRAREAEAVATGREMCRQGAAAIQTGNWEDAEKLLRQGLDALPEDPELRRQLAEACWRRGAANEAMSHMSAAVRLDSDNAALLVRSGEMALASGAKDAALERAEQAIRLDPHLASAWALRGRVFNELKNTDRALADLQQSLVFAPDNPEVLYELATIYRSRGEPVRCLTTLHHLQDTYSVGEMPVNALMLEGLTLMDLKRPQQAALVLLAATDREPPNADLLFHLAQAQSAAGQYTKAAVTAQQALELDSTHEASLELLSRLAARSQPGEIQRR